MKNNSGIAQLIIIAIIVTIISGFFIFSNKYRNQNDDYGHSPSPASQTNELSAWKSYTTQFGLSFKYPDNWAVITFPDNENFVIAASPEYSANVESSTSTDNNEYIRISYDQCFNTELNKKEPCNTYINSIQNFKYDLDPKSVVEKEIMISSKSGTQIEGTIKSSLPLLAGKYRKTTIFPIGDYQIRAEVDNRETLSNYEKVISTFQFIN